MRLSVGFITSGLCISALAAQTSRPRIDLNSPTPTSVNGIVKRATVAEATNTISVSDIPIIEDFGLGEAWPINGGEWEPWMIPFPPPYQQGGGKVHPHHNDRPQPTFLIPFPIESEIRSLNSQLFATATSLSASITVSQSTELSQASTLTISTGLTLSPTATITNAPPTEKVPTTTTTSSEASTSTPCTICLACIDPPPKTEVIIPADDEEDAPWFTGDGSVADAPVVEPPLSISTSSSTSSSNSVATEPTVILHNELRKRSKRDIQLCTTNTSFSTTKGIFVQSPNYPSWSSNSSKNNPLIKSYSYEMTARCPAYDFKLNDKSQQGGRTYATEHVYEIHLIRDFLRWRLNKTDSTAYIQQAGFKGTCDIIKLLMAPKQQVFQTKYFGPLQPHIRPIDILLETLAGSSRVKELFYLETHLNGYKKNIMTPAENILPYAGDFKKNLILAAQLNLVLQYMEQPKVHDSYIATKRRVRAFFVTLDKAIADTYLPDYFSNRVSQMTSAVKFEWADSYDEWSTWYFDRIRTKTAYHINQILDSAKAQIDALDPQQANGQLNALRKNIQKKMPVFNQYNLQGY